MLPAFDRVLEAVADACGRHYGERLVSVVVYGSVGRGTPRHDSDIDLLVVVDPLPHGTRARLAEFDAIEHDVASVLEAVRASGVQTVLSPVLKTPDEIQRGSLLLLDMIDDGRIVVDRGEFMRRALAAFKQRLDKLGARRIWRGDAWYWDLKPDYKPGEVFEI